MLESNKRWKGAGFWILDSFMENWKGGNEKDTHLLLGSSELFV
jgi:hypothetical protein